MQVGIHAWHSSLTRRSARFRVQSRAPPEGPAADQPSRLGTVLSTHGMHRRIARSAHEGGRPWGPLSPLAAAAMTLFPVSTKLFPISSPMVYAPPPVSRLAAVAHRSFVYLGCLNHDTYLPCGFVHSSTFWSERLTCRLFPWGGAQDSWSQTA